MQFADGRVGGVVDRESDVERRGQRFERGRQIGARQIADFGADFDGGAQLCGDGFQQVSPAREEQQIDAARRERCREGRAQALGRAGDDRPGAVLRRE